MQKKATECYATETDIKQFMGEKLFVYVIRQSFTIKLFKSNYSYFSFQLLITKCYILFIQGKCISF